MISIENLTLFESFSGFVLLVVLFLHMYMLKRIYSLEKKLLEAEKLLFAILKRNR